MSKKRCGAKESRGRPCTLWPGHPGAHWNQEHMTTWTDKTTKHAERCPDCGSLWTVGKPKQHAEACARGRR